MVLTIRRDGSSFTTHDERRYDVWGSVRAGSSTGAPAGRYCANLGHQQDDESGLIYMRARYYEPGIGRFVSEDPAMDGQNWFAYCGNDPVQFMDPSGKLAGKAWVGLLLAYYGASAVFWAANSGYQKSAKLIIDSTLATLAIIDTMSDVIAWGSAATGNVTTALSITLVSGALCGLLCAIAAYQIYLLVLVSILDQVGTDDLGEWSDAFTWGSH